MLHMERVDIRELRLNASRLMARVEHGESMEVTSRGRLIARIVPVRPAGVAQLLAEGTATPPEEGGDLLDIPPIAPTPGVRPPSQVLAELRATSGNVACLDSSAYVTVVVQKTESSVLRATRLGMVVETPQ
jgi:prevent-host-death family protein